MRNKWQVRIVARNGDKLSDYLRPEVYISKPKAEKAASLITCAFRSCGVMGMAWAVVQVVETRPPLIVVESRGDITAPKSGPWDS